jgi:peptidoglycan/xylan/chitin deacetylase (PgdA/CDA1 family)
MNTRDRIGWFIWRLGLAALARKLLVTRGRFALNFHGVSNRRRTDLPNDLQPRHSASEFRQALSWIQGHFAFLTADEFLETNQPGVLLTFDDGHANNLNALSILEEFRAMGVFFISTQHVLAPRNWLPSTRRVAHRGWGSEEAVPVDVANNFFDGLSSTQLAELAQSPWAVVGSHTVTHPPLSTCTEQQIDYELRQSRRDLEVICGRRIDLFAYPYGDYNRHVAEAAQNAGYRAAFAVTPVPVGLPTYEIPRVDIYASDAAYLSLKMSGLYRRALHRPAIISDTV